jgi:hypothetical protein
MAKRLTFLYSHAITAAGQCSGPKPSVAQLLTLTEYPNVSLIISIK